MIQDIVLIGSGNLAESLAVALTHTHARLVQIWARNAERGAEIARLTGSDWCGEAEGLAHADLYIVAVSDRAVGEVTERLPIPEGAIVAHTAGSVPLETLPARYRRGVFYPLQTFTKGRQVDFSDIPIFLEAENEETLNELQILATQISRSVHRAGTSKRAWIHLAGVFACNFVNAMYAAGEISVAQAGLHFEVLKPLIRETAAKAIEAQRPGDVQTGPAIRNDLVTQERHEKLLDNQQILKELYKIISKQIWETSKKI